MTSISIIHAPRDEALGDKIAAALASAGHDARRVSPDPALGDLHADSGAAGADADSASIVVWTAAAAKLARLHQQASDAMARGTLIPVAVGGARPPGGFESLTPVDLSGWTGAPDDPRWRFVLEEIQLAKQRTLLRDGEVWADPGADSAHAEIGEEADPARDDHEQGGADDGGPVILIEEFDEDDEPETMDAPPAFLARPQRARNARRFSAREVAIGASAGLVAMTLVTAFVAPMILPDIERRLTAAPARPATPLAAPQEAVPDPSAETAVALASLRSPEIVIPEPEALEAEAPPQTAADAIAALIASEAADDPAAAPQNDPLTEETAGAPAGEKEIAQTASEEPGAPETQTDPEDAAADPMQTLIAALDAGAEAEAASPENIDPLPRATAPESSLGEYFRDCADCPDMAAIPAGSFRMGAGPGEGARDAAEGPVRDISIARGFAIGAREVTFAEWDRCVAEAACRAVPDNGWGRGDRPVVGVSFDDIRSYIAWLSNKTGQFYRLPSEAEWEYAARAGSQTAFAFGSNITADEANFNGNYPYSGPAQPFRGRTTPAASFPPNAFGLYDMHGNAWEWTADCWNASHGAAPSNGSAALSGDCTKHVLKGGAWNTGGWRLRSAHRIGKSETAREFDNGFRLARDL